MTESGAVEGHDLANIIAGTLQISRTYAYELMQKAVVTYLIESSSEPLTKIPSGLTAEQVRDFILQSAAVAQLESENSELRQQTLLLESKIDGLLEFAYEVRRIAGDIRLVNMAVEATNEAAGETS